jgi:hypothetical protein
MSYSLQVRQSRFGTGRWHWRIVNAAGAVIDDNPTIYPSEDHARRSGERELAQWYQSEPHALHQPWPAASPTNHS